MKQLLYKLIQMINLDVNSMNNRLIELGSRHAEVSAIHSIVHPKSKPTKRLLSIFSKLILEKDNAVMDFFNQRPNVPDYVFDNQGEHYKVLQVLVGIIDAKLTVEIGTFTGLSSLSLLHVMNTDRFLYTFDIIPYQNFQNTVLRKQDFEKYNFRQLIDDISSFETMQKYGDILRNADLIFCDAPKDGSFERKVLENFQKLSIKDGTIIFFDDIKQWNMLKIWSEIKMPKLDITPIGHFTGSGIIEWDNKISCF